MSLRAIKDRTQSIDVENDLRGLGSLVKDRPPQYELHVKICEGKEADVAELAKMRGFHTAPGLVESHLATSETVKTHEQAVWHFFLVAELFHHKLVSHAKVRLSQPIEEALTHKMNRKFNIRPYDPTHAISFDASVALHMMRAGYWKNHFSEEGIRKDVSEKGFSDIQLDRAKLEELQSEIISANKDAKEGHRNAR